MVQSQRERTKAFCQRFGLDVPILLAPMAGACPPSLSIAVANAGGMGACGALLLKPDAILDWNDAFRRESRNALQFNLWIPDPPPNRDKAREAAVVRFLENWGPPVPGDAGDAVLPDFHAQCEALLMARPSVVSSVMGLYPPEFVAQLKKAGIAWFATVSTVREAVAAESAGADAVIAQGYEAGGHRAAFVAEHAERQAVGLVSLIPAIVDAIQLPVVATGGVADGRGIAAALVLGASAVQIGTAFLRCPEAKIHPAWADALARTLPEETLVTRAFSGRAGRSIATNYALAATGLGAPALAPYPVQRGLTSKMRDNAQSTGDVHRMQAWAGQSAQLARAEPAAAALSRMWKEAESSWL